MASSLTFTSLLLNKDFIDYYNSFGKNKSVTFLIKSDQIVEKPCDKSYIKSIEKLLNTVKNLKKSLNRKTGQADHDTFFKNYIHFS